MQTKEAYLAKVRFVQSSVLSFFPSEKNIMTIFPKGLRFFFCVGFSISKKLQNPEICAPTSQRSFSSLRPYISILYPWWEEEYEGHKGILLSGCKSSMSTRTALIETPSDYERPSTKYPSVIDTSIIVFFIHFYCKSCIMYKFQKETCRIFAN